MEQEGLISNEIRNLVLIMESHAYADVKQALKMLAAQRASLAVEERETLGAALLAGGWRRWEPEQDLPDNHEYRLLRHAIYVREIEGVAATGIRLKASEIQSRIASYGPDIVRLKSQLREALERIPADAAKKAASPVSPSHTAPGQPKTDLAPQRTDKHCPLCGEEMIYEPICCGGALGRLGFAGRYICMDDMTHEFYVTKPGVELPNK